MAFEAAVRPSGDIAILDFTGEIDSNADGELNRAYGEAEASGAKTVLLNFADVTYINSTGIALIVGVLAQARKAGTTLRACGLSDHYREIFEITRLVDFVSIYDDEASAIGAVPS
jgi:anti-anti-sigma factor